MKLLAQIIGLSLFVAVLMLFILPGLILGQSGEGDGSRTATPAGSPGIATKIDPATGLPAKTDLPTKPNLQPAPSTLPYEPAKRSHLGEAAGAGTSKTGVATNPRPKTKRYFRVLVQDGGTLKAGKHTISLGDIEVRGAKAECTDSQGKNWDCGARARAALAHFIRWRSVVCTLPPGGEAASFSAHCRIGGTDLSQWMLAQGWARTGAGAGKPLIDAENRARKARIGIWVDKAPLDKVPDVGDPGPVDMEDVGADAVPGNPDEGAPRTGQLDQ